MGEQFSVTPYNGNIMKSVCKKAEMEQRNSLLLRVLLFSGVDCRVESLPMYCEEIRSRRDDQL